MNKDQFLLALYDALRGLPIDEVERSIAYYREMIDERVEDGMSEEDAVAEIGSVEDIARQIMGGQRQPEADSDAFYEAEDPGRGRYRALWIAVGALAGVVLLLLLGTNVWMGFRPQTADASKTVSAEYTVEEDFSGFDIQTVASDVRFERSNDGKTRVESRHDAQIEETVEVKNGVLTVRQKQAKRGVNIGIDLSSEEDKLTVYLPRSEYKTLSVETVSGEIILGELNVERASLNTVSGELELQSLRVSGKMALNTVSGDIALDFCDADEIEIGTVSGEVEGTLLSGKTFEVSTTSGDVSVPASAPGAGLCEIGTVSGDVELRIAD